MPASSENSGGRSCAAVAGPALADEHAAGHDPRHAERASSLERVRGDQRSGQQNLPGVGAVDGRGLEAHVRSADRGDQLAAHLATHPEHAGDAGTPAGDHDPAPGQTVGDDSGQEGRHLEVLARLFQQDASGVGRHGRHRAGHRRPAFAGQQAEQTARAGQRLVALDPVADGAEHGARQFRSEDIQL